MLLFTAPVPIHTEAFYFELLARLSQHWIAARRKIELILETSIHRSIVHSEIFEQHKTATIPMWLRPGEQVSPIQWTNWHFECVALPVYLRGCFWIVYVSKELNIQVPSRGTNLSADELEQLNAQVRRVLLHGPQSINENLVSLPYGHRDSYSITVTKNANVERLQAMNNELELFRGDKSKDVSRVSLVFDVLESVQQYHCLLSERKARFYFAV